MRLKGGVTDSGLKKVPYTGCASYFGEAGGGAGSDVKYRAVKKDTMAAMDVPAKACIVFSLFVRYYKKCCFGFCRSSSVVSLNLDVYLL